MKKGLTEIAVVLDKSGSMSSICKDTIGGFNSFIDEQKKLPGEANVTLVLFDTNYEMSYKCKPIKDAVHLTTENYVPRGGTSLNDAVGITINKIGEEFANRPEDERPEKVLMVIITDGEENSSREYTLADVKKMMDHQKEKYSWEFIFIGTNDLNVDQMANCRGITLDKTLSFDKSARGTQVMYASVSDATKSFRSGGIVDMSVYAEAANSEAKTSSAGTTAKNKGI